MILSVISALLRRFGKLRGGLEMGIVKFIEVSKILTRQRIKKIDMLSPNGSKKASVYLKTAGALADGTIKSMDDMADMVGMHEASNTFHVFKMRFFDKLLNSLLFLDLDRRQLFAYNKAISACNRNIHCMRLLLMLSAREAAMEVARQTLKKALRYELTDSIVLCARYMRTHYSITGNPDLFAYYNDLLKKHTLIMQAEDVAAEYFESISVIVVNSESRNEAVLATLAGILPQIELLKVQYKTYQISLYYYRIKSLVEFLTHKYQESIKTWQAFDLFIEDYKDFEYDSRKGESELNKLDCYLHTGDFENGRICAENCQKLFNAYTNNWFIFKEYFLLLSFHTKNYARGAATIETVVSHDHFKNTTENRQEKWKIFEAYLYILIKSKRAVVPNSRHYTSKLQISKFLNETPIFSKDKKGYNISILLVQITHILLERNYAALTDKIDSLERYVYRHLNNDEDYRNQLFLKMVLELERSNFEITETERRTEKLLAELENTRFSNVSGLEIIPFTELWQIMKECLA